MHRTLKITSLIYYLRKHSQRPQKLTYSYIQIFWVSCDQPMPGPFPFPDLRKGPGIEVDLACNVTKTTNFQTKSLRLKRRILFISFQVLKCHVFLCAFDYTNVTDNVRHATAYYHIHLIWHRFTKQIFQSRTDRENGSNLLSMFLWIVLASIGLVSSCCL